MPCEEICDRRDANNPAGQGAESLPSFSAKRPRFTWPQQPVIRDWKDRLFLRGFTLIKLLVVISIIALLLAILLPALQRAKRQANAVACRSKLHQWGLVFSMYTTDNNGMFWHHTAPALEEWWYPTLQPWRYGKDLSFCPMAMKVNQDPKRRYYGLVCGSKFTAWDWKYWGLPSSARKPARGSYCMNWWTADLQNSDLADSTASQYWRTCLVGCSASVPVFLDCSWPETLPDDVEYPPEYEGEYGPYSWWMPDICINRHDGGTNVLFMDWSVRKVGLKELWTLKWHREFDMANPWTRAGGVQPTDWPEWMRKFKDY